MDQSQRPALTPPLCPFLAQHWARLVSGPATVDTWSVCREASAGIQEAAALVFREPFPDWKALLSSVQWKALVASPAWLHLALGLQPVSCGLLLETPSHQSPETAFVTACLVPAPCILARVRRHCPRLKAEPVYCYFRTPQVLTHGWHLKLCS